MRTSADHAGGLLMSSKLDGLAAPAEHPLRRRALPPQYFSTIAAWKDRRFAPDIFELANLRSSIWEACKGKAVGSVANSTVMLGR